MESRHRSYTSKSITPEGKTFIVHTLVQALGLVHVDQVRVEGWSDNYGLTHIDPSRPEDIRAHFDKISHLFQAVQTNNFEYVLPEDRNVELFTVTGSENFPFQRISLVTSNLTHINRYDISRDAVNVQVVVTRLLVSTHNVVESETTFTFPNPVVGVNMDIQL
jgi:hypothetical protein